MTFGAMPMVKVVEELDHSNHRRGNATSRCKAVAFSLSGEWIRQTRAVAPSYSGLIEEMG
jgi:hypothetical protein